MENFPSFPLKVETAKPGPALDKVVGGWEKENKILKVIDLEPKWHTLRICHLILSEPIW